MGWNMKSLIKTMLYHIHKNLVLILLAMLFTLVVINSILTITQ
jgi:hypothetical protein